MKRTWKQLLMVGCLAAAVALAGCSGKGTSAQTTSAVADGVLTVGIIDGQDVFASASGNTYTGMEPDILNRLGGTLGVTVSFIPAADVQQLMDQLDAGTIDVAAGRLGMVEPYSNAHLLSRNYAKKGLYLVTVKNRYVDTLAGFSGMNVGISSSFPASDRVNIPYVSDINQTLYSDLSGVAADIKNDVIKAFVCTEREAMSLLQDDGLQAMEIRNSPRVEAVFYLAPGQTELQNSLNNVINQYLDEQ